VEAFSPPLRILGREKNMSPRIPFLGSLALAAALLGSGSVAAQEPTRAASEAFPPEDEAFQPEEDEGASPLALPIPEARLLEMRELLGEEPVGLQTDHFELYFSIERLRVGNQLHDASSAAQLYAERLEEVHRLCRELMGVTPGPVFARKHLIVLTEGKDAFRKMALKVNGFAEGAGAYSFGVVSMFTTYWKGNPDFKTEGDLHEKVMHHVGHLFIMDYKGTNLGFPAWLHAGFAHVVEYKLAGRNRFFCYAEVPPESKWRSGDWPSLVRKDVARGRDISVSGLLRKPLDSLDYRDMAYSMSLVDFLLTKDQVRFEKLVTALKTDPDTSRALRDVYGWLLGDLEEAWKKHVLRAQN
jgi:hypothetical protein